MVAIERDNPRLKGVLPKEYARPALDKHRLGELIDLVGTIGLGEVMGDAKLKVIATELFTKVRTSVTIDWTLREGARAMVRVIVKRILNKYGYPPDLQDEAVKTVRRQAELLCGEWACHETA